MTDTSSDLMRLMLVRELRVNSKSRKLSLTYQAKLSLRSLIMSKQSGSLELAKNLTMTRLLKSQMKTSKAELEHRIWIYFCLRLWSLQLARTRMSTLNASGESCPQAKKRSKCLARWVSATPWATSKNTWTTRRKTATMSSEATSKTQQMASTKEWRGRAGWSRVRCSTNCSRIKSRNESFNFQNFNWNKIKWVVWFKRWSCPSLIGWKARKRNSKM